MTSYEISSAEEFVRLRTSHTKTEYDTSAHGSAPEQVWLDVINRFPDMKVWIAHNKTVPLSILEILICDGDPHVRSAVASKRRLTLQMFERLANDTEAGVRMTLVHNAKTPRNVLERLAKDMEPIVANAAISRLGDGTHE